MRTINALSFKSMVPVAAMLRVTVSVTIPVAPAIGKPIRPTAMANTPAFEVALQGLESELGRGKDELGDLDVVRVFTEGMNGLFMVVFGGSAAFKLRRLSQFVEISCGHVNRLFQKFSSFSSPRSFECAGFGKRQRGTSVNLKEMQHFFRAHGEVAQQKCRIERVETALR